ncbi:MAG: LPS export ABC transporter periplasmic protein LptC [Zoogloeaceae bacterium]|jgi:lipopolysaccharide export system protein LptC|nr:LPS export ABC transporter periplasmic protein LptC [Zoogloeaceae bacterium]
MRQAVFSQTAATLFPLLVLAGLAGLAFWLAEATAPPPATADGKARHDPDAIVEQFTVFRYGVDGSPRYQLHARRMEHYPDDDSSLVLDPRLTSYRPNAPEVTARGQSAIVTQEGEHVWMRGDVVLARAADRRRPELVARTTELVILPEEGRAFNQHPVRITQGADWIDGIGLTVDNRQGTFTLNQSVRGEYTRKPAGKRP